MSGLGSFFKGQIHTLDPLSPNPEALDPQSPPLGSKVRTFRLAVLECDTPIDPVKTQLGTYGSIFRKFILAGFERLGDSRPRGVQLDISSWDVVTKMEYPKVDDVDGILLTGSKHNSFEDHPWILKLVEYTHDFYKTKKPIVGICFGHQIVARALGAKVGRNDQGWEISVEKMNLNSLGSKIFEGLESLNLNQMHRDIVYELPNGLQTLGWSPRCEFQGLYQSDRVISVQGHPEFNESIMTHILEFRHSQGIFDDALFKDGMERANIPHNGLLVSSSICKFLLKAWGVM